MTWLFARFCYFWWISNFHRLFRPKHLAYRRSLLSKCFYWHNSIIHLFQDDLQAYLLSNEPEYLPTFLFFYHNNELLLNCIRMYQKLLGWQMVPMMSSKVLIKKTSLKKIQNMENIKFQHFLGGNILTLKITTKISSNDPTSN